MQDVNAPSPHAARDLINAIRDGKVKQFAIIAETQDGDINYCVDILDPDGANRVLMASELAYLVEVYDAAQT